MPRSKAASDQRRRILRATAELVAKRGYQDTSTELIVRRAKVGYDTFYKHFPNKEQAFRTLFDDTFERGAGAVMQAYEKGGEEWPERVGAAIKTLFDLIAADPVLARACLVESLTAGPEIMERYEQALRVMGTILEPGRALAPADVELPAMLESTLAGGVFWITYQRLIVGEADQLQGLVANTLQFVLRPYLGDQGALKVTQRAAADPLVEPA